ncbi:tripartite tricarboxylate transporter substrate-binding protein [Verminephrobacter aporrectodeae]|uniref:tripartite tricarboxylate transporter substrate-binding protein n=1 Tax=Verminephrobacter aporrectodeae TaxID=1110389 RepID=UPI00224359E6|nr:tripartite tricarboxylate transporter substrate-binding protein [Verminephrobacter aporrectodeae]
MRRLNDTLSAALKTPDLRERLALEAVEPMPMSAQQFGDYIRADLARWTWLARERRIELST